MTASSIFVPTIRRRLAGGSSSSSEINSSQTTAQGSRIASEGDVVIVARSGDINVTGSHI
ncbi:hemagglutinin repeat-containing protein [Stenotrophomonas sp. 169]|uniref:hemagglutinin repeat-containing protein n=1 Tax=Stenotrophomonas sp. 169 TaxID=2770322 RepID=UPI0016626C9E|nr:hemagglutinin repeat-containing protein [Stenotrophomonas sp. 169]QNR97491.1 hemagglutinin repeat-containing protein [Stenotrophomonas sp. 169]